KALKRVDLPTFGRPTIPQRSDIRIDEMKGVSRSIGIRSFCSVAEGLTLVAVATFIVTQPARAQDELHAALVVGTDNFLIGVGTLPGVGLQGMYLAPGRMYTREALLMGSVLPRGSEGSVHVGVAIG